MNGYQYDISDNQKFVIYSAAEDREVVDVFLYDVETGKNKTITNNEVGLEYDLAVSDSGDYAFVVRNRLESDYSYPILVINGKEVENTRRDLYYSKLDFRDENLYFVGNNLTREVFRVL